MNKKEIVQYLKENMPEFSGDEAEKEIKKAMYIYLELGKIKSSDERYFFGNGKTEEKIYKLHNRNKRNINYIAKNKKVLCITMSSLYKSILKEFGIKCYIHKVSKTYPHVYPLIKLKNGKYIEADLQQDLQNIQTKSRTKFFGKNSYNPDENFQYLSDDEIFNIQKEIGYVDKKTDYMDEKIETLKQTIENLNPEQILDAIVTNQEISIYNSKLEYSEFYKYYRNLIRTFDKKTPGHNLYYFNCYRKVGDSDQKEYSMCIYAIDKEKVKIYLSSNKTNSFVPVDLLTLKQLESNGLFLGTRQNEEGVSILRKYMYKAEKQRIIEKWSNVSNDEGTR